MTSDPRQRIRSPLDLGLIIRERRRALGLDQRTLAGRIGVSRQWIVEIEQGKARAGIGLVLRTLQALGLEPMVTTVGEISGTSLSGTAAPGIDAIDIDAVVARARGFAGAVDQPTLSLKKTRALRRSSVTRSSGKQLEPAARRRRKKRR